MPGSERQVFNLLAIFALSTNDTQLGTYCPNHSTEDLLTLSESSQISEVVQRHTAQSSPRNNYCQDTLQLSAVEPEAVIAAGLTVKHDLQERETGFIVACIRAANSTALLQS